MKRSVLPLTFGDNNETLLFDRLEAIKAIVKEYGEDNFYLSFSGGKDSTVLHYLLDMALPNNKIPRVFCNTGIEYNLVVDFVNKLANADTRFILIKPSINIVNMLKTYGYPFKSKEHSAYVAQYQSNGISTKYLKDYLGIGTVHKYKSCPDKLQYQFTDQFHLKVSDACCKKLKLEPIEIFQSDFNKPYSINGIRKEESGRRVRAQCKVFKDGKFKKFQPLVAVSNDWEDWFIKEYKIELCALYYPPYNFVRTGCKGCPFNVQLQEALDILGEYFPSEKRQCEMIWKPVYEEYRRLNYRLTPVVKGRSLF